MTSDEAIYDAIRMILPNTRLLRPGEPGIEAYARDESTARPVDADLVAFPRSTDEVSRLLQLCHAQKIPVVPRGGGTGKAGGAIPIPGGLVLSTEALCGTPAIDRRDRLAQVGAGTPLEQVKRHVEAAGLFYPPDPSSATGCTIGGNVATNAAGPACVKYGPTRDYVYGLTAVLADGRVLRSGHRTRKSVSGLDLTALLTGSEGTLAVITDVTLRLLPNPGGAETVWISLPSLETALETVAEITRAGLQPRMLELLDSTSVAALRRFGESRVPGDLSCALVVEFDGSQDSLDEQLRGLIATIPESAQSYVAKSAGERAAWRQLRGITSIVLARVRGRKYSEDIAVPLSRLDEAVAEMRRCAREHGIEIACYGHVGDGNLHVNLLYDDAPHETIALVADEIFEVSLRLGGTLSGEHGIGQLKRHMLHRELGPEMARLQRGIKSLFDPHDILNPGRALAD
ncbi:MAG: FAD-binding protein [Myxococcales bacterium]|nr:FAD-binding protein [Myxococcales bacterium]